MTKQTTTLEFQGQKIDHIFKNDQFWVAIKPICTALKINYSRAAETIRNDEILGQVSAVEHLVAADNRRRKMLCLPERYVYGWLFSIRSDNPYLKEYKKKMLRRPIHPFQRLHHPAPPHAARKSLDRE
jgi:prophage antirepressor-like protein